MDKVQLIKEEIERRIKSINSCPFRTAELGSEKIEEGELSAYNSMLQFIDSIPEESSEDLEEYYKKQFLPKEWFAKPGHRTISQFNFFTAQHFAEYGRNHFEDKSEMVSEDLEEEMIRWHKEHFGNKRDWKKTSGEYLTRKSQLDIARHFAEWQKQQMKETLQTEYEKGRFDVREEMMKNAVDAIVHQGLYSKYVKECDDEALANALKNYNSGDKVKIIIVKEE